MLLKVLTVSFPFIIGTFLKHSKRMVTQFPLANRHYSALFVFPLQLLEISPRYKEVVGNSKFGGRLLHSIALNLIAEFN